MLPDPIDVTACQSECATHYRELAIDTLTRSETALTADVRRHYFMLAAYWYERALECEQNPDDPLPH